MHVVIVGNGVAGFEAAMTVRKLQPSWQITIVSEESEHFFSRTALMWLLCGQLSLRDTEPYERDAYVEFDFRRVRGRVEKLDVDSRILFLCGDSSVKYDRLLIASGSKPRPAPWEGSEYCGIGHFVTLSDLKWLRQELGLLEVKEVNLLASDSNEESPYGVRRSASSLRGRPAVNPVVIGGGLIGMEVLEVFLALGLKPTMLIREEWFWPMAINQQEAHWIVDRAREHGANVLFEHEVKHFVGDDSSCLEAVETDHGLITADVAVVAIGVVPNTEWLRGSNIQLDKSGGIVVDESQKTSCPDIYAAGDCASVRLSETRKRPEQLWYTARAQGKVAGASLSGEIATYSRGISYNSAKFMDIEYTTVGELKMDIPNGSEWSYEERGAVRSLTRIVLRDGSIVGFNALGRRWDHEMIARWIKERRSQSFVIEHLPEAGFDTELVPSFNVVLSKE